MRLTKCVHWVAVWFFVSVYVADAGADDAASSAKAACIEKAEALLALGVPKDCNTAPFINALIHSHSPYLLSHAFNPIHWLEWPSSGLPLSTSKLIFVSIGYSTCHWCHVMAKESFEDESIAKVLNEAFVSIKVDRERRPTVDAMFREALEVAQGEAGWPINAIATPEGKLLWIASYQTKAQLAKVLQRLSNRWSTNPDRLQAMAATFAQLIEPQHRDSDLPTESQTQQQVKETQQQIVRFFDEESRSTDPVFPRSHWMRLMLHTDSDHSLRVVEERFWRVVRSATYDSVDGGLHRYSETPDWNAPHFEKMLYDQAQWIHLATQLYRITGKPGYLDIALHTHRWVEAFLDTDGGYGSALSAFSEDGEGEYYLFKGKNLAPLEPGLDKVSYLNQDDNYLIVGETAEPILASLQAIRAAKSKPYRDGKVLLNWNAMYLSSLLDLYEHTGDRQWLEQVKTRADSLWSHFWQPESQSLLRVMYLGEVSVPATLDDYAWFGYLFARMGRLLNDDVALQRARMLRAGMVLTEDQRDYETPSAYLPMLLLDKELRVFDSSKDLVLRWRKHGTSELGYVGRLIGLHSRSNEDFVGSRFFAAGKGWISASLDHAARRLQVTIRLKSGWHINSNDINEGLRATTIAMPGQQLLIDFPPAEALIVPFAEQPLRVWSGAITLDADIDSKTDHIEETISNGRIIVNLQACSDSLCYLPETLTIKPILSANVSEPAPDVPAAHTPYVTSGAAPGYVEDKSCANCHGEIYQSYQSVGMAKSFARPASDRFVENFELPPFYHDKTQRYYQITRAGGELSFRRWQLTDKGEVVNEFRRKIDYVLGSGHKTRSYLYQEPGGELFQLPSAWYTADQQWGLSPGYDKAHNAGVRREVPRQCMFCHNAYPDVSVGSDEHYQPHLFPKHLPEGIGCQRCHGPGARHIETVLTGAQSLEQIHGSIVNPAKLPVGKRDSVCFQCHMLPSVDLIGVRNFSRNDYSFRPGEDINDYLHHVDVVDAVVKMEDRFEINHHAYRLRASQCFNQSQGALTCISCHNPHKKVPASERVEHYGKVCQSCHQQAHADNRTAFVDCTSCHMPQRRTQDVVRVVMTDHKIGLYAQDHDGLVQLQEQDPVFEELHFLEPDNSPAGDLGEIYKVVTMLRAVVQPHYVDYLQTLLNRIKPTALAPYFELTKGQLLLRRYSQAEASARALRVMAPEHVRPKQWLATALLAQDKLDEAEALFSDLLEQRSDMAELHFNFALLKIKQQQHEQAKIALEKATELRPNLTAAWFYLADLAMQRGERSLAIAHYKQALAIEPDFTRGYLGLARALVANQQRDQALSYLRLGSEVARQKEQVLALLQQLRAEQQ